MEKNTDLVTNHIEVELHIKETLKIIYSMVVEIILLQSEIHMKEDGNMAKEKAKGFSIHPLVINMKVLGRMI